MSHTMSAKEAALLWNITDRRVSMLCRQGRIAGAQKVGRDWVIPADAKKPTDPRMKSGVYQKIFYLCGICFQAC